MTHERPPHPSTRSPAGLALISLVIVCLFLAAPLAGAHSTQLSAAQVTIAGDGGSARLELNGRDLEVAARVELLDTTGQVAPERLAAATAALGAYLSAHAGLVSGAAPCSPGPVGLAPAGDHVRATLAWRCPAGGDLRYRATLFLEVDPRARHMVTVQGEAKRFGLLSASSDSLEIRAAPESPWAVAWRYLLAGVEHIAIGFDHIAFLVATVAWGRRLREIFWVITAFTVAHSITLSLATLGVVSPPASLVEPIIAASIVYVAVENVFRRHLQGRWRITFAFGLVHGFGFAGVLREYGLPREALLPALASFNLGVELGQLAIVAAALALMLGVERLALGGAGGRAADARVALGLSAVAGLMGLWWLVERVWPS